MAMTNSVFASIRDWRRSPERRQYRSYQGIAALLLALASGLSHAGNAQQYSLIDLGTLGGTFSTGNGINAGGEVTGAANLAGDLQYHAFLYSNGSMRDLGTLGGTDSTGLGVNAGAEVTGEAFTGLGFHAFLYSNGSMRDLGTFGGTDSGGFGINAGGEVTGEALLAGNGQVHAFLYSNGSMRDLGTLGGLDSSGFGVNDGGEVTGGASLTANVSHAFLYSNGSMQDLGTLGGANSVGFGINAGGQVIGHADTAAGAPHAFLYSNGKMLDLNALDTASPLAKYVTLSDGKAINDKSWIVANGTDSRTGQQHAYLLKPSGPEDLLEELRERVVGVGPGRRLEHLVDEALVDFEAGDIATTCAVLERFRHEVHELADDEAEDIAATNALPEGFKHEVHVHSRKKIDPTLAKALIADAETIGALIGCATEDEHHEQ
jgi:probable HAF family extracellular repeat protein